MKNVGEFFENPNFKNVGPRAVGISVMNKILTNGAHFAQKNEIEKAIRRENRRNHCQGLVREIENSNISPAERCEQVENLAVNFAVGSFDDNQSRANIAQDLTLVECVPTGHELVIAVGPYCHPWNNLPFFPGNRKGFFFFIGYSKHF